MGSWIGSKSGILRYLLSLRSEDWLARTCTISAFYEGSVPVISSLLLD